MNSLICLELRRKFAAMSALVPTARVEIPVPAPIIEMPTPEPTPIKVKKPKRNIYPGLLAITNSLICFELKRKFAAMLALVPPDIIEVPAHIAEIPEPAPVEITKPVRNIYPGLLAITNSLIRFELKRKFAAMSALAPPEIIEVPAPITEIPVLAPIEITKPVRNIYPGLLAIINSLICFELKRKFAAMSALFPPDIIEILVPIPVKEKPTPPLIDRRPYKFE
jgi:hypothetical protein